MTRASVLMVAVAALAPALMAVPRAQTGAARVVEGRVVADDTGEPISNAKVGFSTAASARATLSGADGRFALDVPAGVARLIIVKTGFARGEAAVQAGRVAADVRLARGAIISGRVSEASGEPAVGMVVRAQTQVPGSQRFSVVATSGTDDRGEFRLSGLSEGRVVVSVQLQTVVVYFPGVESASEAEVLDLKPGDEIDRLVLPLPARDDAPQIVDGGVLVFGSTPPLRPPAPGEVTAVVRGRVVSATGGVLAGARVRLTQQARRDGASTQTDRDGRFAFAGVVPGPYLIGASKTGFASDVPAFRRLVTVTATGADAELTLMPLGSLTGRVLDELGDPVQGAATQLLRLQFQDGRRRLVSAGATRATDDRGVFRLFGVPPGQYILSASVGDVSTAELPGYVRTFYPGVADAASSAFVTLGVGQSLSGADITLVRERTVRVSGIVRDAQGQAGLVGSLNLLPSQSTSALATSVGARISRDGAFEFPNVPAGRYVIQAYRGARNRSTEGEFAALPVSVGDRDLEGLTVQATSGSVIAGRVSFLGSSPGTAPPRSGLDIEAVPSDPDLAPINGRATADIRSDWSFVLSGISGPRRLEVTRVPPGWALKEIRVRGIDVTDRPIGFGTAAQSIDDVEVVLTDRLTRVAGRVRGRDGRAAANAAVIVFAPYRDRWYSHSRHMRAVTANADGGFSVDGLPPGTYYVAAVATLPAGGADAWRDPSFLESLVAPSASVSVGDGGQADVAVTLAEPR